MLWTKASAALDCKTYSTNHCVLFTPCTVLWETSSSQEQGHTTRAKTYKYRVEAEEKSANGTNCREKDSKVKVPKPNKDVVSIIRTSIW